MNTPHLADIDPAVLDREFAITDEFRAQVYTPQQLKRRLAITDDSLFWFSIRERRIPAPIFLNLAGESPSENNCFWFRELIDVWIAEKCPADPIHEAHRQMVFNLLLSSARDQLSEHPPTLTEQN